MTCDLLVKNGVVVDGTGKPPIRADLAIKDGRIVDVGLMGPAESAAVLDAGGLMVCPGIIDIHSHSDFTLVVDPRAMSSVMQGVTLEVVGNCGHGSCDRERYRDCPGWSVDRRPRGPGLAPELGSRFPSWEAGFLRRSQEGDVVTLCKLFANQRPTGLLLRQECLSHNEDNMTEHKKKSLLIMSHADRHKRIRIISTRKATRRERTIYEND